MSEIIIPADNGNGHHIRIIPEDTGTIIRLEIRPDLHHPNYFQWFNFFLQGTPGEHYTLQIENAGKASYPGWDSYQTYASYGNDDWFAVPTVYDKETGTLTMDLKLEHESIQFAYFPPYSYEKHLNLIEQAKAIPHCHVTTLGKTNGSDGRDITLLTFG